MALQPQFSSIYPSQIRTSSEHGAPSPKRQPAGTASSIGSRTNGETMNDRSPGAFGLIPGGVVLRDDCDPQRFENHPLNKPLTPARSP